MKTDATHKADDRLLWYNAHELIKDGLSDFSHITTSNLGHYIFLEEPGLVKNNILNLIA